MNEQIFTQPFDLSQSCDVGLEAAETYVRAAQHRLKDDRAAGLAALDLSLIHISEPTRPY